MSVYFNEFDKFAAQWLRNLYPDSTVDERDIRNVQAADVAGFERCHFFGGIGGWEYALSLAGWSGPVWTGSCPCQPLSCAGKREGEKDERHLWPEFYRLISECRPPVIFGEQAGENDGLEWVDGVSLDLEELGYAVGACDMPASGVKAAMRRQRFWWGAVFVGNPDSSRRVARRTNGGERQEAIQPLPTARGESHSLASTKSFFGRLPIFTRKQGAESIEPRGCGETVLSLTDGTSRRASVEPSSFPLAYGIPRDLGQRFPELRGVAKSARSNRVGRLRGYGNAIVPKLAAEFIKAFMEVKREGELNQDAANQ